MSDYPESEKQLAIAPHSQAIGEFVEEFLPSKGIQLAEYDDGRLLPATYSIRSLLAEFFDIDLDKVESEQRQMLADIARRREQALIDEMRSPDA